MRKPTVLMLAVALAGCGPDRITAPVDTEWEATVTGTAAHPAVNGTATVVSSAGQSTATIMLSGVAQGSVHPWHVHRGTCDSDLGIVGDMNAYPLLEPDAEGNAAANVTIGEGLVAGNPYFVNVHLSPEETQTIVACGQLIMS